MSMKKYKFLKILSGIFFVAILLLFWLNANYPILIKWVVGSARVIGRPLQSKVYINGRLDTDIQLFKMTKYWDEKYKDVNILIAYQPKSKNNLLGVYWVNLSNKDIEFPISSAEKDYDFIFGRLFQSETGVNFISLNNPEKAFDNFNINLKTAGSQITFFIPHSFENPKADSVKIVLVD